MKNIIAVLMFAVAVLVTGCSTTKSVVKTNAKPNCALSTDVQFEGSY
jgi:hypothetical protein